MTSTADEKHPLLHSRSSSIGRYDAEKEESEESQKEEEVHIERHITLLQAIAIMVGNVIGSGIFVSPKGVTANIGSVGASLLVWTLTGLYNLLQALCYAELGCIIPKAGGDYAYIYEILGPLGAFITLWVHILVIASASCAIISQTAALYLIRPFDKDCVISAVTLLSGWMILTLSAINALSSRLGAKIQTLFTVAKVFALLVVIGAGIVKLAQGYTHNFENAFDNTNTDPGSIALAVLDGYFAYKGWELINALGEEMINPSRNLPITVYVSMTAVTAIYVLTNLAYFTVLSPSELLASDAVALSFANKALGSFALVIPLFVSLSCMGAVNGNFLSNSRYPFAGARYNQAPQIFSFIHTSRLTPFPAVVLLCVIALLYCVIHDLQTLQEYASLVVQLKMLLTLVALFYLRWKKPHIRRPIKVNTILAIITLLVMVAIIGLSFYKSPLSTGIGAAIFVGCIPVYYLVRVTERRKCTNTCMDKITIVLQKLFLVVPETNRITAQSKTITD